MKNGKKIAIFESAIIIADRAFFASEINICRISSIII